MARKDEYVKKTEKLIEPILAENNFELYDLEFVKEAGTGTSALTLTRKVALRLTTASLSAEGQDPFDKGFYR